MYYEPFNFKSTLERELMRKHIALMMVALFVAAVGLCGCGTKARMIDNASFEMRVMMTDPVF